MGTPSNFSCLIIDDDVGFISMLTKVVSQEGWQVKSCSDLNAARREIERAKFDLVVLDNRLPDGTGYDFHPQLARLCPGTVVVMVTGIPELGQAVHLTRNGLFDYLTKPLNVADFVACLRRVRQHLEHPDSAADESELTGESPAMRAVIHLLNQLSRSGATTVLLLGETGVGKDIAARMLHRLTHASRATPPAYVPLNCSAVPAEMFEAELFGSEKGAYTGAEKRREGLIEAAEGGTLFLDEITETPMPQQAKLLRFLDSHEYRPLGSNTLRTFTGRVVAAANRSLPEEIRQGRFREDLMYRLSVATVVIPPLRERLSDIGRLTHKLLAQLSTKYGRERLFLKPGDVQALAGYHFPGNVRELRNLLERAVLRTPEDSAWLAFDPAWLSCRMDEMPSATQTLNSRPRPGLLPERQLNALELQEYCLIQEALRSEDGGIRRAAARLGITHQALMRRLTKWPELRHTVGDPC